MLLHRLKGAHDGYARDINSIYKTLWAQHHLIPWRKITLYLNGPLSWYWITQLLQSLWYSPYEERSCLFPRSRTDTENYLAHIWAIHASWYAKLRSRTSVHHILRRLHDTIEQRSVSTITESWRLFSSDLKLFTCEKHVNSRKSNYSHDWTWSEFPLKNGSKMQVYDMLLRHWWAAKMPNWWLHWVNNDL